MAAFAIALALAVLPAAGCRDHGDSSSTPGAPQQSHFTTAFDLIEEFAVADIHVNTTRIDFGTREGEGHLIAGWGKPEILPDDSPVQWAMGHRSSFWFFTADRRAVRLDCRMWPFVFDGAPSQRIAIWLNGVPVTTLDLEPRQRTYQIDLPRDVVAAGRNRIDVDHAYSGDPVRNQGNRGDLRPLAVLWDWLTTDLPASDESPHISRAPGRPTVVLPPGTGVDFFLRLPSGSQLTASSLSRTMADPSGDRLPPLIVTATADQPLDTSMSVQRVRVPVSAGGLSDTPSIPIQPSGIVRLSLLSPPVESTGNQSGSIEIAAPRITAPLEANSKGTPAVEFDRPRSRPNVVIYLIDTLRSDHLGAYGYDRPISPNIDAFAEEAVLFQNAIAQTSWTRPAVASILTGLSIPTHGIIDIADGLPPTSTTTAEILREIGYSTAAFTLTDHISTDTGFDRGFGHFSLTNSEPEFERELHGHLAITGKPLFAYVHTIEPHTPYEAEPNLLELFAPGIDVALGTVRGVEKLSNAAFLSIYDSHFKNAVDDSRHAEQPNRHEDELIALYDAEIASADARFGRFVARLRELGQYDDTLLVLVADHGEEFYDHGRLAHGMTLYGEQLRIPLIIRFPSGDLTGKRVAARVSQIDILPTILDYLGVATPDEVEGRSLLPLVTGQDSYWDDVPAFSYLDWYGGRAESVVAEGAKLIHNLEMGTLLRPKYEVYDLGEDPSELDNIADRRPVLLGYLQALLRGTERRRVAQHQPEPVDILDPAFRERMRALGYLE